MAVGNFIIRDDKRNDVNFTNIFHSAPIATLIRYENHPESVNWTIYDSIEDFDGDSLGIISNSSFEDITINNFPNSEYIYYDNILVHFKIYF